MFATKSCGAFVQYTTSSLYQVSIRRAFTISVESGERLPRNYWDDLNNQREFLERVSKQLNIKDVEDWYKISRKDLESVGGSSLLNKYRNSPSQALTSIYPEHNWLPWKFDKLPLNYFDKQENQLKFIKWASEQLNIKEMSDWYKITHKDLLEIGGGALLQKYNNSPIRLLSALYPDYEWSPWKFDKSPNNFFINVNNQKTWLEWAKGPLNINEMSDWYKVTIKDYEKIGGSALLAKYNESPSLMLSSLYPDYEWLPWKFDRIQHNFWEHVHNQRKFMEWAGNQLNIKNLDDWYNISPRDLDDIGGITLLQRYKSLSTLLSTVFPEHNWMPWRFQKTPRNTWKDPKLLRTFLEWAGPQLGIKQLDDWQQVSMKDLISLGGIGLIREYKVLPRMLLTAYPEHNWEIKSKVSNSFNRKSQALIHTYVRILFPQEEVLEDYRHPDLLSISGSPMELDFFYPKFNLAIEYQGEQHYKISNFLTHDKSLEATQLQDLNKASICKEKGITLIEVPYWWDRRIESLAATIHLQRPELFKHEPTEEPIRSSPPTQRKTEKTSNPTRKVLMTATNWDNKSMNPKGWWMTEKYDGMRLYWTGSEFYTRHGTLVKAPESWSSQMPKGIALDGELWTQYGLYQNAVHLSRISDESKWAAAQLWVFDAPGIADKPYEERVAYLKELKSKGSIPSFVNIIEPVKCKDHEHLQKYFDDIISKGGEGVMLREAQSQYKAGRSESLRRYKPFFDTEAKVLANKYPHGFLCLQTNGKEIFVALDESYEAARNIKEGAIITLKHLGLNVYGKLQQPKFYRERTDASWEDLIKT